MPGDNGAAGERPWGHGLVLRGQVRTLSVGRVQTLRHGGIEIPSAIAKSPVAGPVLLTAAGLPGDEHGDASTHGGPDKAVCVYPWEHYSFWADQFDLTLGPAAFGENVTSIGLLEDEVFVGDVFEWGAATVQVSQPRRPCFKIGARFGHRDIGTQLERTRRTGFYLRVLRSGKVSSADQLILADVDPVGLSLATVSLALSEGPTAAGLSVERLLLARHLLPTRWVEAWELGDPHATPTAAATQPTAAAG